MVKNGTKFDLIRIKSYMRRNEAKYKKKKETVWLKGIVVEGRKRGEGVFPVNAKNAFLPVKRDNSVNTYSRISSPTGERAK